MVRRRSRSQTIVKQRPADQTTLVSWHHTKITKIMGNLSADPAAFLPNGQWCHGTQAINTGVFRHIPGCQMGRRHDEGPAPISDMHRRGYTGSFSHVARFVAPWRQASPTKDGVAEHSSDEDAPAPARLRTLDPATGQQIAPLTAAALCVKPRGLMTERQLASVDVLKAASTACCTMRDLAMRLRGLLRGGTVEALNIWLTDARSSNIHGMRRFSRAVPQDMAAVTNAVLEPWRMDRQRARSTD
jgi:hypothetical protein